MNDTNSFDNNAIKQDETVFTASYSSYKTISSSGVYMFVKAEKEGKSYILKTLKEENRDRLPLRTALKKEFKQCKNFSHAGIVRYNELVQTDEYGLCIEMEYIEGRSLKAYLSERHTDDEKAAVIRQIASALQYIHEQGVVHRNLNTQNIFVSTQGDQVKVADFNVLSVEETKPTSYTSRFIAPELRDETMAADATADIYSLGTIMKVMGLTLAYSDVIKRACAFKRSERYTDIGEFLADFCHEKSAFSLPKVNAGFIKIVAIAAVILVIAAVIYGLRGVIGEQLSKLSSSSLFQDDVVPAKIDTVKSDGTPKDTVPAEVPASGKLAFMNAMKPALYKDLDRIFSAYEGKALTADDRAGLTKHIKIYYRGLIQANDTLDNEQRAELDRVFGDYVKQKKAALK